MILVFSLRLLFPLLALMPLLFNVLVEIPLARIIITLALILDVIILHVSTLALLNLLDVLSFPIIFNLPILLQLFFTTLPTHLPSHPFLVRLLCNDNFVIYIITPPKLTPFTTLSSMTLTSTLLDSISTTFLSSLGILTRVSHHITNDINAPHTIHPYHGSDNVQVSNGTRLPITHIGTKPLFSPLHLNNILVVSILTKFFYLLAT